MTSAPRAVLVGGGIGTLAAAAFMIRDAGIPGAAITVFEAGSRLGGALDGAGDPDRGYSLRGGRMLTTDHYECTWDLFRSIPSLEHAGQSVYDETVAFNRVHVSHSRARLVDCYRSRIPVESMGFSVDDRLRLLALIDADEADLGDSRITDHFAPHFFATPFWLMWATTFAFQPWHSAAELRRYLHRFMSEFPRIETLAGVKRTVYNQYDALIAPLEAWLRAQGVLFESSATVLDVGHAGMEGELVVTSLLIDRDGERQTLAVAPDTLVIIQNGSMTDASSLGAHDRAPARLGLAQSVGWHLWERLSTARPAFGRPEVFNSAPAQSSWESFTVTLRDRAFVDAMMNFSGNEPGTGGLVTFKDSNWLMSIVVPHQPYFAGQPDDVQVFWGYGLFPDRVGNFVARPMMECTGAEILVELCGHLRFEPDTVAGATCIPCWMPYITSMFMPRKPGDRPRPVPDGTRNLAFVSQFVEVPDDVVFTVEYSVRAAQMTVYEWFGIDRPIPPITRHDKSLRTRLDALVKAFR